MQVVVSGGGVAQAGVLWVGLPQGRRAPHVFSLRVPSIGFRDNSLRIRFC